MDARKEPQPRPESIPEAAEKAGTVIRRLQSRLAAEVARALQPQPDQELEEMERELQEAFAREEAKAKSASAIQRIRHRVVDSLADRILAEWGVISGSLGKLEDDVSHRLVGRIVMLALNRKGPSPTVAVEPAVALREHGEPGAPE